MEFSGDQARPGDEIAVGTTNPSLSVAGSESPSRPDRMANGLTR
jgi:hypothetical protein